MTQFVPPPKEKKKKEKDEESGEDDDVCLNFNMKNQTRAIFSAPA